LNNVLILGEEELNRCVNSALRTLESAGVGHEHRFYNRACFKAHQATEKAIEALLWVLGNPLTGHSLPALVLRLKEVLGAVSGNIVEFSILHTN